MRDRYYLILSAMDFLQPHETLLDEAISAIAGEPNLSNSDAYYAKKILLLKEAEKKDLDISHIPFPDMFRIDANHSLTEIQERLEHLFMFYENIATTQEMNISLGHEVEIPPFENLIKFELPLKDAILSLDRKTELMGIYNSLFLVYKSNIENTDPEKTKYQISCNRIATQELAAIENHLQHKSATQTPEDILAIGICTSGLRAVHYENIIANYYFNKTIDIDTAFRLYFYMHKIALVDSDYKKLMVKDIPLIGTTFNVLQLITKIPFTTLRNT